MKGAIVTGSAQGLGKAIAIMLAKEDYAVAINYRKSAKEAMITLKELRKINSSCISVQGDMTKEADVKKLIKAAKKKFGNIYVLVNNIGDFLFKPLLKTTPKEIETVFRNNVLTGFMCSKEVLKVIEKHGRIINIGSTGCDELLAPKMTTPYYMSKTSVVLLTRGLAKAVPQGITVNAVNPGILTTSVVKKKGVEFTTFKEVTQAIKKLIKSDSNGKIVTVAKWKPEG